MALNPTRSYTRRFGNKRTVLPAVEPVTLTEVKEHLRITDTDSDGFLSTLITQAREILEELAGIAFITQTWKLSLDDWTAYNSEPWWDGIRQGSINELHGSAGTIELPRYPLQSVDTVTTYDWGSNATSITVATTFDVDINSRRGRLSLQSGKTWPSALRPTNAIEIVYTSGYGDAASDVPSPLKRAINVLIAYLFDHRGNCGNHDAYNRSGAAEILRLYRDMKV